MAIKFTSLSLFVYIILFLSFVLALKLPFNYKIEIGQLPVNGERMESSKGIFCNTYQSISKSDNYTEVQLFRKRWIVRDDPFEIRTYLNDGFARKECWPCHGTFLPYSFYFQYRLVVADVDKRVKA